ncbi:MAG: UDP-N-acetylmuramate dehydrogenase [Candidatus Levyibacteriota bacterium]
MRILENAVIAQHLWYKIGGTSRFLLKCENTEDILEAFQFIKKEKIKKFFIAGLGSNVLFPDGFFDGAVIQISSENTTQISLVGKETLEVFAGVTLDQVIRFGFQHNLIGLEWAGGLPGTVGAAVRGNVGAFGGEIKDIFAGAEVLDASSKKLEVRRLTKRDIRFGYRSSTIKKNPNLVVLSAKFKLVKVADDRLARARQSYFANIEYRKLKHPMEFPSTGSAFKNISEPENIEKILAVFPDIESDVRIKWHGKVSIGYLNKRLDLSGLQIGGAQISNKHSNFIVNTGGATAADVNSIINKVQQTFQENFGFKPEPEVEIVQ